MPEQCSARFALIWIVEQRLAPTNSGEKQERLAAVSVAETSDDGAGNELEEGEQ